VSQLVWKAEVTSDMVAHLKGEEVISFIVSLNNAVDALGTQYKVGREYENGQLKENNHA
jgi:hypothetical protein